MNTYKITFLLNPRKALQFKSEKPQPLPEWLFDSLGKEFSCDCMIKLETSFNVLSVIVCTDFEVTGEGMTNFLNSVTSKEETGEIRMDIKSLSGSEALNYPSLSNEDREKLRSILGASKDNEGFRRTREIPPMEQPDTGNDAFDSVEKLIGADELKTWAREMKALSEKKPDDKIIMRSLMSMTYLISVNNGNGSTTVFESIGNVLAQILGISHIILREYTAKPDSESKEYNIEKIITDTAKARCSEDKLYVYAIWADEFQSNKHSAEWIRLLSHLRQCRGNAIFIFAIPYLERLAVNDMHNRIEDILPNRTISVRPLTNEDYVRFFERYFSKHNMEISEASYPLLSQALADEKSDGRFYGINTVEKICDEISYNKMMNSVSNPNCDRNRICPEDIRPLLHHPENDDGNTLTGMQKLDAMISLDTVKARIKEIVATLRMQRKMNDSGANSMHMMFSGAPGTGKTVVARILGEILRENNLLSCGGFYEVSRKDLVGSYVGHTAPKTAEVCKLAYGSVLFIDEAYLLDGGSEKDFGKEAIGTLIAEMENKRNDLVVIFAGYEKELENLFDLNPGLRDRIPYRIHFNNYSRDELLQIFYKMLPSKFSYDENFDEAVRNFFENLSDEIMEDPNFSNGRFVRNLIERLISKAALRIEMEEGGNGELKITAADFNTSVSDGEFASLNTAKKPSRIGFLN